MVITEELEQVFYRQANIDTFREIVDLREVIGDENLGAFEVKEGENYLILRLPKDKNYIHYKIVWVSSKNEIWIYVNGSNNPLVDQHRVWDSLDKIRRHLTNWLEFINRRDSKVA